MLAEPAPIATAVPAPVPVPVSIPIVVVQAARLPDAAGDPAFSIIRVDPTALASGERLDEVLETVPGFSLFRRTSSLGANPTTQGVSLRGIAGSGASRALVTLDGVPQNDPFGGWVIWTALPPETIAAATIVRGAGAGPYGAGALTGVVALQQPTTIAGGTAGEATAGGLGYGRVAAITEAKVGSARLFLDASGESSDGWTPVRAGRGSVDRPLALKDWSAAERLETDVGGAALSERVGLFREDRGAGTVDAESRVRGAQASVALAAQPDAERLGWRLQAWLQASDLTNTSASVAPGRNAATLADDQYATPATGSGVNGALRRTAPDYGWELGADVREAYGESKEHLYNQGTPSGDRLSGGGELTAGVYGEGSRSVGATLLTASLRVDRWEDFASKLVQSGSTLVDQRPADQGGSVPSGRIGLRRDLAPDLYLRAAVYANFRPATLNELHRPFRVGSDVTEANAALTPERLYGAELGLGGRVGVDWDADVFYNRLADAITNVTIGKGPGSFGAAGFVPAGGTLYARENAGVVNAVGVEGEAHHAVGAGLELRAAFSYTHARVDGGDQAPQLTGLRPAQTPSTTLTGGATWRPAGRLALSGELRYESARFDDDQNTRRIDAGLGVDARASWRLSQGVEAYVVADNLFDAAIQTGRTALGVVSYDAPRIVRVGVSLRR